MIITIYLFNHSIKPEFIHFKNVLKTLILERHFKDLSNYFTERFFQKKQHKNLINFFKNQNWTLSSGRNNFSAYEFPRM